MPDRPSDSEALRALADRFWGEVLESNPTYATILGDRRFDDRLADVTPAAVERELAQLDRTIAGAEAIDAGRLSPIDRITRRMLVDEASAIARLLRTRVHEWTVDQQF